MKIGYLIPKWPGQTQIWNWREISLLREWGADITIFATRPPLERDKAKHTFAETALAETVYLWPRARGLVSDVFSTLLRNPRGFFRCIYTGLTLPVTNGPAWRKVLPLLGPACILARECLKRDVRHLHARSAKSSAILCMMVKRLIGTPYSVVVNANLTWWGGAMAQKLAEADFVVTHALWIREDIKKHFPFITDDKLLLAPVGVDTRTWQPYGRRISDGLFRIVSVSRLHPSKGHDVLIKAFARLVERGIDADLRIIGAGPARDDLAALVRSLHLDQRVHFLGSCSDDSVRQELSQSDAFALASHAESLGVVYMEAMALGLATVGTSAGGVSEIIEHNRSGLLVPPKDSEALAECLVLLAQDPELRMRLGTAGRERIVSAYDSRKGAKELLRRFAAIH